MPKQVVTFVSVGEPSKAKKSGKDIEIIQFIVHGFGDRTERRGERIESPMARAHGYDWKLWVYPRGNAASSTDREFVSCYLYPVIETTTTSVAAAAAASSPAAWITIRCKSRERTWKDKLWSTNQGKGYADFIPRDEVLEEHLEDDGSLAIECDICIAEDDRRVWYPPAFQPQSLLVDLYENASSATADTVFSVGGGDDDEKSAATAATSSIYRVHKAVLSLRCKKLYEIAEGSCDENDSCPIRIPLIRARIFKSLLDFVYMVRLPEVTTVQAAVELLCASDRYECVSLKLYVESLLADRFLTANTATALFVLADSLSCALLKEAATKWILADIEAVKETVDWTKLKESHRLFEELFMQLYKIHVGNSNHSRTTTPTEDDDVDADLLDVASLRVDLQKANLGVDGSREVLAGRWKTLRSQEIKE